MTTIFITFIIPTINTVCCLYVLSILVGLLIRCHKNRNAKKMYFSFLLNNAIPIDNCALVAMMRQNKEREKCHDR